MTKGEAAKKETHAAQPGDPMEEPTLNQELQTRQEPQASQESQTPEDPPADQDSNPFDFGGLPDRNLKKNLGCG